MTTALNRGFSSARAVMVGTAIIMAAEAARRKCRRVQTAFEPVARIVFMGVISVPSRQRKCNRIPVPHGNQERPEKLEPDSSRANVPAG